MEQTETKPETEQKIKKIRHLVLSGGGDIGISFFGALRASNEAGFWNIEDIQSIYATSAGSLFGTVIALIQHVSWETLDVFFKKRPWEQVFDVNVDSVLKSFANCGILGRETAYKFLSPVLLASDLGKDVTMREFFEHTGIDMHYMTTNLDKFELVDVSHKTHPDWKVVEAVYASCALPVMFQPITIDGTKYADGAIFCNFPIKQCLANVDDPDEIFAMQKVEKSFDTTDPHNEEPKKPNNDLLTYLGDILLKLLYSVSRENEHGNLIKHILRFPSNKTNLFDIYRCAAETEYRIGLRDEGIRLWEEFFQTRR